MRTKAIKILDAHRTMTLSTVRPDGWPQSTIVGYANRGFALYFMIFRTSQKFANIAHDRRVAIAVGHEPNDIREAEAVYAGAIAAEVTDPAQRDYGWRLLNDRHPNLAAFVPPSPSDAAIMLAECKYVSVVDYSEGLGHNEDLILGPGDLGDPMAADRSLEQGKQSPSEG